MISDDQAIDLLASMLRIPSLCGQEDHLADFLMTTMAEAGFDVYRDEVGNVIGSVGADSQDAGSVLILGHMDTVPGSIPVERRDGALYGRGAVDAKGPLAAALVAAARSAGQANLRITVIGAVQEEGPSLGARHLVARPAPDYLIIAEPSGWDAVVLGYKGSQRFSVRVSQPNSHTASPEPTAPERAVRFWNDLVARCATVGQHSDAGASPGDSPAISHGFDSLTPTLMAMSSGNDGLEDTATLQIGMRLPPGLPPEAVQAEVRALLPDGVVAFAQGEPAVRGEKNSPLTAAFLRSIRAESRKPRIKVKTGTSDMNVVGPVWRCPMLAYGPGDSRLDHTPDEHIEIDDYLHSIRVLTHVLEEL